MLRASLLMTGTIRRSGRNFQWQGSCATACHGGQHMRSATRPLQDAPGYERLGGMDNPPNTLPDTLDICNIALSKLGESPISALSPNGSPAARLCYMHYHPVRREVLCATRWSFATRRATLQAAADESADGSRSLAHTLPTDCLRVLEVSSPGWTLRGRRIYCPAESIRLLYTADEEDTGLFEPLFTEALATRLACKLCIPLTSSTTARQALTEEYQRISLPQAAHANAVQAHSNDSHPLYRLWRRSLAGSTED